VGLPWRDRNDGSATVFIRSTGWAIVLVTVVVVLTLIVRRVDLNPFIVGMVGFGLASGLLAARTGRTFVPFLLLLLAAYPTIFGWYVFFYLPLLLLLMIGGVAGSLTRLRRGPDPAPSN
jgi:hypothetical protein